MSHEERMLREALIRQDKLSRKRQELNRQLIKECQNFKPKINKKSEKLNKIRIKH